MMSGHPSIADLARNWRMTEISPGQRVYRAHDEATLWSLVTTGSSSLRGSYSVARQRNIPGWLNKAFVSLCLVFFTLPTYGQDSADPASCQNVRLADIGWTDVTATTAVVAEILTRLHYHPSITVLSVPVTYASLKNQDIDVFLGNWMPSMEADRHAYVEEGSVEVLNANLTGAKYTLAVPEYTYQAGLRDFKDINRFAKDLNFSIYGIEPGNDGNRLILKIIKENQFGLKPFHLVESSEQGMLSQVDRAINAQKPIVFLAWDPHPMNIRFKLHYLTGGDATFGPNLGGASIYTNTRAHYRQDCPNVHTLLRQLSFNTSLESEWMSKILDEHQSPNVMASAWVGAHPDIVAQWLTGVRDFSGKSASMTETGPASDSPVDLEVLIKQHKLPLGQSVTAAVDWIKHHGKGFFDGLSLAIRTLTDGLLAIFIAIPTPLFILGFAGLSYALRRSLRLSVFVVLALEFIVNQGYWDATLETLSLVLVAAFTATVFGVPIGIYAAYRPRVFEALRPLLDLMQTLPTFVYLTPTLVLFGLGVVPGLISTVIFAIPAPIRLTHLGISQVPTALLEAGEAFGATRWQRLLKIELPAAAPAILAGVSQAIMLSLSMVVIAALVGAGGLGVPVVRALNTVQVGMGFEAGLSIVLLAIVLDRLFKRDTGTQS